MLLAVTRLASRSATCAHIRVRLAVAGVALRVQPAGVAATLDVPMSTARAASTAVKATSVGGGVESGAPDRTAVHDSRYTSESIARSEFIYGEGYQGPGGADTMRFFSQDLQLKQGERVLEIGCGLGGPANYLAQTYGVTVTGMDVQPAMIEECKRKQERMPESPSKYLTTFLEGSATDGSLFEAATFDVVFCRDTLLYLEVAMKAEAFANIAKWLKPGGRFMVGDFGHRSTEEGALSHVFLDYMKSTDVHMIDFGTYKALIEGCTARTAKGAGQLVVTKMEAHTELFRTLNTRDLEVFRSRRMEFCEKFLDGDEHADALVKRWEKKIAMSSREDGSFVWQRFVGHKVASGGQN